ncbi:MAG: bifunctional (p)ppGpp synthetase/guanosine-3',5'-bis(diphosphate) 3'-pyrophosphohydrolase [Candidatus Krumholzibacteriota bacterium]|nr:bifunctional (p)ppGpp synthetase/guanosine-3',5'-bis(diphosphate) 3'-pyrophosphohydrolase [Candidatus Krumholzibacteriota bacterium]
MSARSEHDTAPDAAAAAERDALLALARQYSPQLDGDLVERAFWRARAVHAGQRRRSGDPYFDHVLAVARTVAEMNLGSNAIAAALLHDAVEDTPLSVEILRQEFNPAVALLVDGVSKIAHLRFASEEKAQAENFRKLLLQMSKDIRILLIKLADRLHNMQTLEYLERPRQLRIARETMDIYAPLANRLGIGRLKWELEDLAFKYLEPEPYACVAESTGTRRESRDEYIQAMRDRIRLAMEQNGIDCAVQGRAKHFYSIYRKMLAQNLKAEEVLDQLAFRIITQTVADCYHALGVVHTVFTPLPKRFKDYVATPKRNGYRSLHTAVIGPDGTIFEVQIRTREMHQTAEFGIAAHWRYKDGGEISRDEPASGRELDFLRTFLEEIQAGEWSEDPSEFMASLKINLFQEGIFVFTPRGDLHILPAGATPVDFAYAIHTEVGDHTVGARIDGKQVPLRHELTSGEVVEIITRKNARPSRDWLSFVRSAKAVSRIKRRLRETELEQSLSLGRELLEREFKRHQQPYPDEDDLELAAEALGVENAERVVEGVGRGNLSAVQVFNRIHPPEPGARERPALSDEEVARLTRESVRGVRVEGHGNLMIRFAGCCRPVPGDAIIGVVTRGRGISIHRADCLNISSRPELDERLVNVEWDVDEQETFLVGLVVAASDRPNLLAELTERIGRTGTNLHSGSFSRDEKDLQVRFHFTLVVRDLGQLDEVIRSLRGVRSVHEVTRI